MAGKRQLIREFFRLVSSVVGEQQTRHKIYPLENGQIKGRKVYTDTPIRCRLCDRSDGWYLNSNSTAFVCDTFADEHEPTPAFGGYIHTLDSVSVLAVGSYEVID